MIFQLTNCSSLKSSFCSANNDNWNGFDNGFEKSTNSYQGFSSSKSDATLSTSAASNSIKKLQKNEKEDKGDFSALDVKASAPKQSNKSKSIEDDAWNLLNN